MVQRLLQPGEIETLDHTAIPRLVLPQPASLFTARAARLRQLANNDIKGIPVDESLSGYLQLPSDNYVCAPKLGNDAGPLGAIALAMMARP